MARFKWEKVNERTCLFSNNKERFFGSFWSTGKSWYAHFCPLFPYAETWYVREFPLSTDEKKVKKECEKFINDFKKEENKWLED